MADALSDPAERTDTLRVDGYTVAYASYGDPSGDPALAFHGTPGSRLFGALFDDAARRHGVRVVVPDRPGYGRSAAWSDRSLADAGALTAAVLDDVGAEAARVIGFSGGGPHALAAAATRPVRISSVDVVAGAVPPSLRATPPAPLRVLESLAARTPRLLAALSRLGRHAPDSAAVGQYATSDDEVSEAVRSRAGRDFRAAFEEGGNGFVAETRLLAEAWADLADRVDRPVRLFHGGADENVPLPGARRLADRLPTADLTVLDGADHLHTLLRARPDVLDW
ncbi:MAG: alpha/beta fold hydrolase [Halobacteriaceae archaeon]